MIRVNIHEAKSGLSSLIKKMQQGEMIVICQRNKPIAELRPFTSEPQPGVRRLGLMPGSAPMDDKFSSSDATIASEFNEGSLPYSEGK